LFIFGILYGIKISDDNTVYMELIVILIIDLNKIFSRSLIHLKEVLLYSVLSLL